MNEFVRVANVNDLPPGQCAVVTVGEKDVALFNLEGEFHALENSCPHHGAPLGMGSLDGCIISCPWHGWMFDVRTGSSSFGPGFSVEKYEVQVEDQSVMVKLACPIPLTV